MALYIDKTIYTSAPLPEDRLEKEMRVYSLLDELNISYKRIDHEKTETIGSCEEVDKLLDIQINKNLFLRNTQKTNFYLLLLPGDKKFKTNILSKQIGSARLSFAEACYMEEFLDITPGSVSVLGLMNDVNHKVQLLIDRDLMENEYMGCHPCINTSSLKVKTTDIINMFLNYTNHKPIYVEL